MPDWIDLDHLSPADAGTNLAKALLDSGQALDELEVDLRDCPPALLISGFFQAVLQHVHETEPTKLEVARQIAWKVRHDFQRRHIAQWVGDFVPLS
jgi:hypothetical protein